MEIPAEWQNYRRKNLFASIGLVAGLPSVVAIAIAIKVIGFESRIILISLITTWCLCWGYYAFRVARCPCPRCGKPFFANQDPQFQFKRKCSNCGLGLYEKP